MLNKNTVENLNLHAVVKSFCLNEAQCDYVTERLVKLSCDVNEIHKMQGAVQDIVAQPKIVPELKKALSEIADITERRSLLKRNLVNVKAVYQDNHRKKTRTVFGNLSDVSKNILKLLRQYLNVNSVLGRYTFSSEYMRTVQNRFKVMTEGDSFHFFGELINKLSNIEKGNNDVCLNVILGDEPGDILVEFASLNEVKDIPGIRSADHSDNEIINRLTGVAVEDLCNYLNDISAVMLKEFEAFLKALMFYNFATNYVENLKLRGVPYVYPDFEDSKNIVIKDMYSIHLVAKGVEKIRPLNVSENDFTVVYGANNTGKTCYVRGIALSYIFAQAGLPIPAKEASLYPVSDILSHFASGEKSLGRFEEELKSVDEIFNEAGQGKLVIFNETFQSTVYEEIAQPFKDILDAMVKAGAHALVVTHNEPFIALCRDSGDVKLLKMNDGHEIGEVIYPI